MDLAIVNGTLYMLVNDLTNESLSFLTVSTGGCGLGAKAGGLNGGQNHEGLTGGWASADRVESRPANLALMHLSCDSHYR